MSIQLPQSEHFTLHRLGEGIYAAISIDGTGSMGNAGILDLGDETLVFDTMMTPQAAEDLRSAAEQMTGHNVSFVVNSHYNADHHAGNMVFAGARVIATERTRELIAARGAAFMQDVREHATEYVREEEERLAKETDPHLREQYATELGTTRALAAAAPRLHLRLPDVVFTDRLTLFGSRRRVDIQTYGGGHTESDAFAYLAEERIIFLGDLLFTRSAPSMWQPSVTAWIEILARVEALDPQIVVPGHGPVSTIEDVRTLSSYLSDLRSIAAEHLRQGAPPEALEQIAVPAHFAEWARPDYFHQMLRAIYDGLIQSANPVE